MNKLFTKEAVEYTDDHKDSPEYCKICGHFIPPKFCRVLVDQGPVVPGGWCMKFYYSTGFNIKPFMVRGDAA